MMIFGVFGYLCRKFEFEGAPLILALLVGPIFEINLRQSLIFSNGSFTIFFNRPISAAFTSIAIILLITSLIPYFKKGRKDYEVSRKNG